MADSPRISVLGLGAMGAALAATFLRAGYPTMVWNRTPGKDSELVAAGAHGAPDLAAAIEASEVIVACLFDHTSVYETLDPVVADLSGRILVNLTSTRPEEARELANWAAANGIEYLDGGIMATPNLIGQPVAAIYYSGSQRVFDELRTVLEALGTTEYFGEDPGYASTVDFALLAAMYSMFAGVYHGAAMVRSVGMSAEDFARRAANFLPAMTFNLPRAGKRFDSGDYTRPVQDLRFAKAALDAIVAASRDAGVDLDIIGAVRNLIDRQIANGHGADSYERMFESLNPPRRP
ncbi:NAD(P)-dependent oxidoreductase [Nocardia arthritidis]|uniref:NAD(P)-dependent oxidoreductase n=1 Tax=Nocardia arthritidis TaxID=228602 RepID=A0A6G9YAX6_9NOCA|nr:NAD(P)-binding domain-containing protein [Nocardia arthritidis]QIS10415.1 NAD(P)-dependent oxidoreductase [Nocardia arthritidis]